jgi:tetratricopeptide (TPR) repeat protein
VRRITFILLAALGLALTGRAEETGEVAIAASDLPAVKSFKTGLLLLKDTAAITRLDARLAKYREALAQFDAATAERNDFYPAQASAAYCLTQLAELTTNLVAHQELFDRAMQRYEVTSQCPGAEARVYGSWASTLIAESSHAADPTRRREMLDRAVKILDAGQRLTESRSERSRLAYQFGRAELFQAQLAGNRPDRRALYESALAHFQTASEIDSIAKLPQLYASWGIVLLELGRSQNDRRLWRQAIERLQTALEKDPNNFTVRYNLVCAYALLDQTDNAMRHLRQCLDNDDAKRTYFNAARQDPDLDSLRATAEFNDIFGVVPNRPVDPFEKPAFSDK